ncbi:hypothetical protein [Corynebacterium matruchotii]
MSSIGAPEGVPPVGKNAKKRRRRHLLLPRRPLLLLPEVVP